MAAKQRPQEMGLFYKPESILLSTAPRWHAITHMAFTLDSYFLAFFKTLLPFLVFLCTGKVLGVLRHQRARG